jgi:hypothetical protein
MKHGSCTVSSTNKGINRQIPLPDGGFFTFSDWEDTPEYQKSAQELLTKMGVDPAYLEPWDDVEWDRKTEIQGLLSQVAPDAVLSGRQFVREAPYGAVTRAAWPTSKQMVEKAKVLQRYFDLKDDDFVFIEGGKEGSNIRDDVMLIRDPSSGEWAEFDSPAIADLADVFELGGASVLNPVGALDLIMSAIPPLGATVKGRLLVGPIAEMLGKVGAEEWGRMTGTELSTREQTFDISRLGMSGFEGLLGAAGGESISLPFKYSRAGISGITPEAKAVQQWARSQGLPTIPTAAMTPIGRSATRQWAATSRTGGVWSEDHHVKTLRWMRENFDLKAPTEADMATDPIQNYLDKEINKLIKSAQAEYRGGFNNRAGVEMLAQRSKEFSDVLEEAESALVPGLRRAVEKEGLAFDTTLAYDEFFRVSRGPGLLGQPDATGAPTALFPDRPEGELAEIVSTYLNLADELPVVRDNLTGTVTNPVDPLVDMYRRLRKLQGTGNSQFNDDVSKLVAGLEEVILSPVVPGTTLRGAPGELSPIRATLRRSERGQFMPREVPDSYRGAAQAYLDRAVKNDELMDATFLRAEVIRATGTGQVDQLGRNLISPNHPARIAQIKRILRGANMGHEWDSFRRGYLERLMENPHKIDAELAAWRAVDPAAHKTYRNVISKADEAKLTQLAGNYRRITSGPIAKTAGSMSVMTRDALLALRGADPSQLRKLIADTGGVNGSLAKVLRTEVIVDIIGSSERAGMGGMTMLDPQLAAQQILDLRNSGNLDLIFPKGMIRQLDNLPEYLAQLPIPPGFAEGLLAAEIAQAGMQALLPVSKEALKATIGSRAKVYRNRIFAGIFLNKYMMRAPTQLAVPLKGAENFLHAASVGLAGHLTEHETALQELMENPDVPINQDVHIPKKIGDMLNQGLDILDRTGHRGIEILVDTHSGVHEGREEEEE